MNVATRQENMKTKTVKRKAGEKRTQAINFKEAACCRSGEKRQKNDLCEGSNWNPWEGQQSFRPNTKGVGDHTTTLRRLLIDAALVFLLKARFFPCLKALRFICCIILEPSKGVFLLWKFFLCPALTYASPEWFPFLNVGTLERFH